MTKNWRLKIITLWFGQAISILTSSIVSMCIVWYLTIQTGSAAILTTAVIITYLPQAFLSLFAGVLIDRFNKKYIIILSDLFLALTSVVLAYLFYTKEITLGILLFMLSLRGIGSALHSPTTKALTPLLVPKEHLVAYSGYSQVFSTISNIVSPAIALTLNSLFPLHTIVLIDAFGALLAVLLFLPIAVPYVKKTCEKLHIIRDFMDGFHELKNTKGMMCLCVVGVLYCLIYAPIGTLFPHISMVYFGGDTDMAALIEVLSAIGALVGSFGLGFLTRFVTKRTGLWGSIMGYGISLVVIGLLPQSGIWIFAVLAFLMGITIPIYYGIVTAMYQLNIKEAYLGRVFTMTMSANDLAMPLSLVIGGAFADTIGVNTLYFVLGLLCVLLAFVTANLKSIKEAK